MVHVVNDEIINSLSKMDPKRLLSRWDVAEFLHISLKTLYRRCKEGLILFVKTKRNVRFEVQAVLEYINRFRVTPI